MPEKGDGDGRRRRRRGSEGTRLEKAGHLLARPTNFQAISENVSIYEIQNIQMISGKLVNKDIKAQGRSHQPPKMRNGKKKPALMALEQENRERRTGEQGRECSHRCIQQVINYKH